MTLTFILCTLVFLMIFVYLLIDARCSIFLAYFSREYICGIGIVDNLQSFIYS